MMHPFFFFGAIHGAIIVAVLSFFVLFAASKADGFVKLFGNVLGYLLLIVLVLCIVAAVTAPLFGGHPFGMTWEMHQGMWAHMQGPPPAPGK